jgi:hypothetical protein
VSAERDREVAEIDDRALEAIETMISDREPIDVPQEHVLVATNPAEPA